MALFPDDGTWYRAKILEVKPTSLNVLYLDYGNTSWVPTSLAHEPCPVVVETHALAMQCVMHEAEPVDRSDKILMMRHFNVLFLFLSYSTVAISNSFSQ